MQKSWLKKLILPAFIALCGFGYIGLNKFQVLDKYYTQHRNQQILADYSDNVVLPGLQLLTQSIQNLHLATLAFNDSQEQLERTTLAWKQARKKWKQTAAYQFGPASFYGLDKQIAAWPTDTYYVDYLIQQEKIDITADYLRNEMDANLRGLHTAEYLLFRDGKARQLASITPKERDYLRLVTNALLEDSLTLEALWRGKAQLTAQQQAQIAQFDEIRFDRAYSEEFKAAGDTDNSRYYDQRSALQEIFQESVELAETMCPAIGEAFNPSDPTSNETWFADTTLSDFLAELESIQQAYQGGEQTQDNDSIALLVAQQHETLARRIEIGFADMAYQLSGLEDYKRLSPDALSLATRRAVSACFKLEGRMEVAMAMVFPAIPLEFVAAQ